MSLGLGRKETYAVNQLIGVCGKSGFYCDRGSTEILTLKDIERKSLTIEAAIHGRRSVIPGIRFWKWSFVVGGT